MFSSRLLTQPLNIVGKGSGWEKAPDNNVWGITQLICRRPVNRVIDMNDYSLWGKLEADEAEKAKKIAKANQIEYIDRDNYPLQTIIQEFKTDYFGSTVDYALALAIHEGFSEIHMYGVNMANNEEYAYQKPSCEFWIGYAMGMGIEIVNHSKLSSLLHTKDSKLYGYGIDQGLCLTNS